MKKEILELQRCMADNGIDVYIVPAGDPHGSEYVNDHFKFSEYLSGLLAENEILVVSGDGAWIWTDGRFFLQAERELAGSGIELMKMAEDGVPTVMEFLKSYAEDYLKSHDRITIGFDGKTVPASMNKEITDTFEGRPEVEFIWDRDLSLSVWEARPAITPSKIWEFPLSSAGASAESKIGAARLAMKEKGADCLILTDLTETAWLLNLRGADIDYTPVFFSYIILTQEEVILYVMDGALADGLPESLSFVKVRSYDEIYDDVRSLPEDWKVWMDLSSANYALFMEIPGVKAGDCMDAVINEHTPVKLAKTVKNETEIASTINAHIKDGVAVTRFIKWLKDVTSEEGYGVTSPLITEIGAADYLEARRREQDGCFDLSFETISGYGPNGAIIHYAPSPETNLEVKPEGFLLVDSGGQYIDGTTDITRTIAVGPLTQDMIDGYTRVLKGHIALSRYIIRPETTHKELDDCTRAALREVGLDYKHGVSHGVGHVLAVHEGPAGVSKKDEPADLKPGMIMSNEPGLYMAGEYGIRIENEILLKDAGDGTITSEPITYVPYERAAINADLLTDDELDWINAYHAKVRELILPRMDSEDADFLISQTEPIVRQ